MATPVAFAPRRQQQAPEAVVGTAKKSSTTSTALWVLGLLTASAAITVAVYVLPPEVHKNAYFLAISCFFFTVVGGVMSAVSMDTTTHLHHRHATSWRKVMHVLHAQLASVGTAFSTTTALGVAGLVAASTAIAVVVCVPPPELHKNAYFLAVSCFFFAGVRGVMSAVCMASTTHLRHRHATSWRKVMHVLHSQLASVSAAFSTTNVLGVLGLAAASTAITLAVCVPPPALHKNAYFLTISCFFFAGVAGVMSTVCMAAATQLRHRDTTGRKLMYVLLARLASVVVGAAFSTTTVMGVLGLAAASTAMNLQSVCQPHQPPRGVGESDYYYHLAISAVFFAGVAGVMAAVRDGGQVAK